MLARLHRTRHIPFGFALLIAVFACILYAPRGLAGTGSVPMLLRTKVDITPDVLASITAQTVRVGTVWPEIRAMAVTVSSGKIAALQANPYVDLLEPNLEAGVVTDSPGDLSAIADMAVPLSTSTTAITTWNQDMANTSGSLETGAGVTVVVLDSGLPQNWSEFLPAGSVDLAHAAGFAAEGWGDFHSQDNGIRGAGGHIGLFPHGLAVSSVIVGFPSELGFVAGAAPDARILPVRVLNQFNFGFFDWFISGLLYATSLKTSGAITGPMVVNFSIQATGSSAVLTDAINYAIAHGVLFVTIAGNFNPFDLISYPGRLPQCITAGAAGWRREGLPPQPWFFGDVPESDASQVDVASFSGREPPFVTPGSLIDVIAPGSFVFGEWLFGPGFSEGRSLGFSSVDNFIFGTSFAAPHVAGIVACMLEKNPGLTQASAELALRSSALPVPSSGTSFVTPLGSFVLPWDARATGAGLVQGAAAVAATPLPPAVAARFTRDPGGADGTAGGSAGAPVLSRVGSLPVEISYRALGSGAGLVRVMDVRGRLVRRLRPSETGRVTWDGRRDDGAAVGSGIYFVQRGAGPETVKVVVAR